MLCKGSHVLCKGSDVLCNDALLQTVSPEANEETGYTLHPSEENNQKLHRSYICLHPIVQENSWVVEILLSQMNCFIMQRDVRTDLTITLHL